MAMRTAPPAAPPIHDDPVSTGWTWVALILALIGSAGTLYLSIGEHLTFGMDLDPCPLCFYQRTFMLAVAAVLLVGLFAGAQRSGYLSMITMPLTVAGLAIATIQVVMETNDELSCPKGALVQLDEEFRAKDDLHATLEKHDSPPRESLAIFALLFLVQVLDLLRSGSRGGFSWGGLLAGIIIGGLLAAGAYYTAGNCAVQRKTEGEFKGEFRGCVKKVKT
jgi:hypothetical protein